MRLVHLLTAASLVLPGAAFAEESRVELWNGLYRGMTAEEATLAVASVDGVKAAKVKVNKKTGAKSVDISHKMASGGDFGGEKGFVELEFDNHGLKAVIITFSPGKNAYRDLVPHCLSEGISVFSRLKEVLPRKYEEVARTPYELDESFAIQARGVVAEDRLKVMAERKRRTDIDLVSPAISYTDGTRVIVLDSGVYAQSWQDPNARNAPKFANFGQQCESDLGIQMRPKISYKLRTDYNRDVKAANDHSKAQQQEKQNLDRAAAEDF